MPRDTILTGHVLSFDADPLRGPATGASDCARLSEAVLIRDGRVAATGALADLRARAPGATLRRQGSRCSALAG